MSRINIQGTIDSIKSHTNIYTPIIEAVVNSIDSIASKKIGDGRIEITLHRASELNFNDIMAPVTSITILDNGLGFNKKNRDSFDTFYSQEKRAMGGKGFGRFMFVKYFEDVQVKSVFRDKDKFMFRTFRFGKQFEIIDRENVQESNAKDSYAEIRLQNVKNENLLDKGIDVIARKILNRILVFFLRDDFQTPLILIKDDNRQILLNDLLKDKNEIFQVAEDSFTLKGGLDETSCNFLVKIFKLYYPGSQKSKVILTANNRSVVESSLHKHIPEFEDDFYDLQDKNGNEISRNYIIRSYVLSDYLDVNVSTEREGFDFDKNNSDIYYPFSQVEIERSASELTRNVFGDDVSTRIEKKTKRIKEYVNEQAPWHKSYFSELDLSKVQFNIPEKDIEMELQRIKFEKESKSKIELRRILHEDANGGYEDISQVVSAISEIGKSDLAHYVYNRKLVLEVLKQTLKRRPDGKGELEKEVHNLIYPMGGDSESTSYEDHNLWLLDERLVFSEYVASDKKIGTKADALKEPDLLVFDKKQSFRNGDNEYSNPLTIFEFKRPKRTTYSEADDPIVQIGNYLDDIKAGKYEMPEGLEPIRVNDNTPVYGYVVCSINDKIRSFAKKHQLSISPNQDGYFGYHSGYKMYVEILDFSKLLKDATLRNKVFFKKLMLE